MQPRYRSVHPWNAVAPEPAYRPRRAAGADHSKSSIRCKRVVDGCHDPPTGSVARLQCLFAVPGLPLAGPSAPTRRPRSELPEVASTIDDGSGTAAADVGKVKLSMANVNVLSLPKRVADTMIGGFAAHEPEERRLVNRERLHVGRVPSHRNAAHSGFDPACYNPYRGAFPTGALESRPAWLISVAGGTEAKFVRDHRRRSRARKRPERAPMTRKLGPTSVR